MPLDTEHEGGPVRHLHALDDAVLGPGDLAQPRAQPLDRLVMERVHLEIAGADHRVKARAFAHDLYPVGRLVARRLLAVVDRAAELARNVLVERATERDVE